MSGLMLSIEAFLVQPLPAVVSYVVASVVLLVLAVSTIAVVVGKKR